VNNVAKHARASHCTVTLARHRDPDELRVEVRDDGHGLSSSYTPGVGLRSMGIRAEELGGSCSINAVTPTGTLICARLPIDEP
jgi:signal transduction histidine kinase